VIPIIEEKGSTFSVRTRLFAQAELLFCNNLLEGEAPMKPIRDKKWSWALISGLWILALGLLVSGQAPVDKKETMEVQSCDGSSVVALPAVIPGVAPGRSQSVAKANLLLAAWMKQNPERAAAWMSESGAAMPAHASLGTALEQTQKAAADSAIEKQPVKTTARDKLIWEREQKNLIAEGYRLFHSSIALGGTIGISCDMCHPDSSNTHPETYPKFQTQLKKVALLRDMINWCIENPGKGKPLPEDDARLRAVEAYIYSQRKGVALEPGKH
jgi:thiosulfate dehydrogenase